MFQQENNMVHGEKNGFQKNLNMFYWGWCGRFAFIAWVINLSSSILQGLISYKHTHHRACLLFILNFHKIFKNREKAIKSVPS